MRQRKSFVAAQSLAEPEPLRAAQPERRRHCSSRPLRLRPPFPRWICLKLPKTSAAPVPAAAGEYLSVVRLFAQLWPGPDGGGPPGLAGCGADPCGESERGGRAARTRRRAAVGPPARSRRPLSRPARNERPPRLGGEAPTGTSSRISCLLSPFSIFFLRGGGEV